MILLDFIDLESYLHCGTFAKKRMSVSIRILEINDYLIKILEKDDLVILEGLLRRKMENGVGDAKMFIWG